MTGATGFIGSHLVESLLEGGSEIICLVRKSSRLDWLRGLNVTFIYGELTQKETLHQAVHDIDVIYHLAGLTKALSQRDYDHINFYGTRNLLEACSEQSPKPRRFVFLSSLAAAGPSSPEKPKLECDPCEPVSSYGLSKLKAEQVVQEYSGE